MENVDNFFDRIYIDFISQRAIVWKTKKAKDTLSDRETELWSLKEVKDYIRWLQDNG